MYVRYTELYMLRWPPESLKSVHCSSLRAVVLSCSRLVDDGHSCDACLRTRNPRKKARTQTCRVYAGGTRRTQRSLRKVHLEEGFKLMRISMFSDAYRQSDRLYVRLCKCPMFCIEHAN